MEKRKKDIYFCAKKNGKLFYYSSNVGLRAVKKKSSIRPACLIFQPVKLRYSMGKNIIKMSPDCKLIRRH